MARKTTGNTTIPSKKTGVPAEPAAVQATPEIQAEAHKEVRKDVRKNGKPANPVSGNVNLEEEIRRRAYELYLERRATAGGEDGNQNQDWLIAEREVRSRLGGPEQHTA
jgi:Protein of unknown function (DUF2934)